MMKTRTAACLAAAFCFALTATDALAHAKLKSSLPASGATVKTGLSEIKLLFGEKVEPSLSTVTLSDGKGAAVPPLSSGPACTGAACLIKVAPLTAGDYTVKYHVLSADGHVVDGTYVFHVKA